MFKSNCFSIVAVWRLCSFEPKWPPLVFSPFCVSVQTCCQFDHWKPSTFRVISTVEKLPLDKKKLKLVSTFIETLDESEVQRLKRIEQSDPKCNCVITFTNSCIQPSTHSKNRICVLYHRVLPYSSHVYCHECRLYPLFLCSTAADVSAIQQRVKSLMGNCDVKV